MEIKETIKEALNELEEAAKNTWAAVDLGSLLGYWTCDAKCSREHSWEFYWEYTIRNTPVKDFLWRVANGNSPFGAGRALLATQVFLRLKLDILTEENKERELYALLHTIPHIMRDPYSRAHIIKKALHRAIQVYKEAYASYTPEKFDELREYLLS